MKLLKIERKPNLGQSRFDIEVSKNHNFFANGVLVHNSQFSFGKDEDGKLYMRSKGKEMYVEAHDNMFSAAVQTVLELKDALTPGWTYRGEYLKSPKHNALKYERIPNKHIILFDVNTGMEEYLSPEEKAEEAKRLGLECVPVLGRLVLNSPEQLKELLNTESVLGGVKIEGVVCKQYELVDTSTAKMLFAKYVSEAFKEVHRKEWGKSNPSSKDVVTAIGESFKTEAFWNKAVQHLRDDGGLEEDPRDIGPLIKYLQADIEEEWAEDIKDRLWNGFKAQIKRTACHGFPEWYKEKLVNAAFNTD